MRKTLSLFLTICFAGTIATAIGAGDVKAAAGTFGIRGGFDFDADQVVVGFQAELGRFLEITRFAPSVDFGFGNDLTTIAFNGDFRIYLTPPGSSAELYGSAGPTLLIVDTQGGNSDSEVGLTLSGGVKFGAGKGRTYNLEGRFGFENMPEFRLLFGIYF